MTDRVDAIEADLAAARQRIAELTDELDATNRGIIALHTELEAARDAESRARAEREVLAERDRIGRDLQDQVIHRMFDAAMRLQGIASLLTPATAQRIGAVIAVLDATIRDLRTAIFGLHDQPQQATSLRIVFANLVTETDTGVDFTPSVRFEGPIDAAVPDHIADDLLAATRDALATIADQSDTTLVDILLQATTEELVLTIHHDGSGDVDRESGLRERAHAHGGTVQITGDPATDTTITWHIPLTRNQDGASARAT